MSICLVLNISLFGSILDLGKGRGRKRVGGGEWRKGMGKNERKKNRYGRRSERKK